jgi:ABC-type multidrug transport system fused ATPase/permease subunit
VDFSYPSRMDVPVFQNFSLKIPAGERSLPSIQRDGPTFTEMKYHHTKLGHERQCADWHNHGRWLSFSVGERLALKIFFLVLWMFAGKTVALVGQSGSGKSTVIALLERFYDPLAGEVLIDGANIKDLQLKWLRRQIGLVSQEPALFATSIRENILYGKDGATEDEVMEAAKSANAYNFVTQLPRGFDTQVRVQILVLVMSVLCEGL